MADIMLLHGDISPFFNGELCLLPFKRDADQEDLEYDVEEEGEEEPQFLDVDEMQSVAFGGHNFRRIITPSKEVTIVDGGKKYIVAGQFLLTDPWWKVTCKVQPQGSKYRLRGYQAYTLKTSVGKNIVSLFLTECGVADEFKVKFNEWLEEDGSFSLAELPTILKTFGETDSVAADHILPLVEESDAFTYVNAASKYPLVMEHLPTLLPWQFKEVLRTRTKRDKGSPTQTQTSAEPEEDTSLLARLEEVIKMEVTKMDAIKTDVWKLGFKYVLHDEFNIIGCEATLNAFKECDVFKKIPQCQQHALLLYDHLKKYFWHSKNTYIEVDHLTHRIKSMDQTMLWEALDFLREQNVVKRERKKVMLQDFYTYETGIASCLQHLVEAEPWHIELNAEKVRQYAEGCLDQDQVRAAKMICSNPVTVISGKGGCGKTMLVRCVFEAAKQNRSFQAHKKKSNENKTPDGGQLKENSEEDLPVILLTAPTGRAAALLSQGKNSPAYTLHQVLYSFHNRRGEDGNGAQKPWRFSRVQVLVVDEGSLVGVRMLYSLLSLLTCHAQLRKFIILGDVSQLPSIEPGNVLNDLFSSLGTVGWSIEMKTNHRAESELIVENAALISKMGKKQRFGRLEVDATIDFNAKWEKPSSYQKFIRVVPEEKTGDVGLAVVIQKLLEEGPGLEDDVSSQFVAFRKNVCALINELCCKHYSKHCTKRDNRQLCFQRDDKVCCTRNGYVVDKDQEEEWTDRKDTEEESKERSVPKERLCNGEIFFIEEDKTEFERGTSTRFLTLNDKHGRVITTRYGDLKRECRPQHAWARTIHTFQGSEVNTIVYVLGDGRFQTWRHVYTAVTRGRARVYLVAEEEALKRAIEQWDKPRKTRLGELLSPVLSSAKRKRPSREGSYGTASKKTRDANDTPHPSDVSAEPTLFKVGDQVLVETVGHGGQTWTWSDSPFTVTEVIPFAVKVQGRNEFISHSHLKMYKGKD